MSLDDLDNLDNLDNLDSLDGLDALDSTTVRPEAQPVQINSTELERMVSDELDEMSEKLAGFKARARDEDRRFELATDTEYVLVLTFQTRQQADAYLTHYGLPGDEKYLDGYRLALQQGVPMPKYEQVPYNTSARQDRKLAALVQSEEQE